MKKYLSVLLVMGAAFILTAAGPNEKKVPELEFRTEGDYVVNDEDIICGEMSRDYIYLSEDCEADYPELKKAFDDFNKVGKQAYKDTIDQFTETCLGYDEMMRENFDPEDYTMYCKDVNVIHIYRLDEKYLSFANEITAYWGGDEVAEMYNCYNYDIETGKLVSLTDVIQDEDAFDTAIRMELSDKYSEYDFEFYPFDENEDGEFELSVYNPEHPDWTHWCLTPVGIEVFFDNSAVRISGGSSTSVVLGFDEYPDILDSDYAFEGDEYVVEFTSNEWFKADINDDGQMESISFYPNIIEGAEDSGEYCGFTICLGWIDYDDISDDYYYAYDPYFVHKADGDYIYVHLAGYEGSYIRVIKIVDDDLEDCGTLSTDGFMVEDLGSEVTNYLYKGLFFTDPAMVDSGLTFENLVCGSYLCECEEEYDYEYDDYDYDEDDYDDDDFDDDDYDDDDYDDDDYDDDDYWDEMFTTYEISSIDGRRYIEYSGPNAYAAAEIELFDEIPVEVDGSYYFMANMYPFSSFSFAGDYWGGEPYVCFIRVNEDGEVDFSEGQPFSGHGELELIPDDNLDPIHYGIDNAMENDLAPDLIGSWRAETEIDGEDTELYAEFNADGTMALVEKIESVVPFVHVGIYELYEEDGEIFGNLYLETLGNSGMPFETTMKIDSKTGAPIIDDYYYAPSDVSKIKYTRTTPGNHDIDIEPGPCDRRDELNEDWEEYCSYEFTFDYNPDFIESLGDQALEERGAEECDIFCIEENVGGGMMWMRLYNYDNDGEEVIVDYAYYDFGEDEFYYMSDEFE